MQSDGTGRGRVAAVLLVAGLLIGGGAHAQEAGSQSQTPQVDETTVALSWLQGRFLRPVTCIRKDGTRVEVHESLVIRRAAARSGMPALRMTFFGIDLPDVEKCFNLVENRIPDRRGVLYLTYRSRGRTDTGMSDFKRTMRSREIRYHVVDGELRLRPIGEVDGETTVIRFDGRDFPLRVRPVQRHSDGDKLLEHYLTRVEETADGRRRLRFEIDGPEGFHFVAAFIEDDGR